jgi:hypothetical protein
MDLPDVDFQGSQLFEIFPANALETTVDLVSRVIHPVRLDLLQVQRVFVPDFSENLVTALLALLHRIELYPVTPPYLVRFVSFGMSGCQVLVEHSFVKVLFAAKTGESKPFL